MILYHGTTMEVREPKILRSEIGRDFGFAFYTVYTIFVVSMHGTIRATLLPEIVRHIMEKYGWSEEEAMERFYEYAEFQMA